MADKSKKPTGLSITRNGKKFTFSWKKGDSNYKDGQQCYYKLSTQDSWHKLDCGTGTTTKTISIDPEKYFPETKTSNGKTTFKPKLKSVSFKVRGKRDGSKYTWSDYAEKTFDIEKPNAPTAAVSSVDAFQDKSVFAWDVKNSSTAHKYFRQIKWESVLVKNDSLKADQGKTAFGKSWKSKRVGSKLKGTSSSSSNSHTFNEDSSIINAYDFTTSYTRWFRVRSRGPRGSSSWIYKRYVYSIPIAASNVKVDHIIEHQNSYDVHVKWNSSKSQSRPINKIVVQYTKQIPNDIDLNYTGDSWTDAVTVAYKDGSDAARFSVSGKLERDQCLYVRVNTYYDGYTHYGDAVLAKAGILTNPTVNNSSFNYNSETNRLNVALQSVTSVPGAFHEVILHDDGHREGMPSQSLTRGEKFFPEQDYIIGIIPNGSTSITNVDCPGWVSDYREYAQFGVRAVVGSYEEQDSVNYKLYSVTSLATSDKVWEVGAIYKAPENVTVNQVPEKLDTVRVTWDWSWAEATGIELSWADHDDAWESTDEPQSYNVNSINSSKWNISGLETGKKWYVRVRFIKEDENGTMYGAWSKIFDVDLSMAPNTPAIELSTGMVASDGEFTVTWGYTTNDGTPQSYASICMAEISNGEITYGEEIANAQTAQHVSIDVPTLINSFGWALGTTYHLCVKVTSESGQESEWSSPEPIQVVEPLSISIDSWNLLTETEETNPRDYNGSLVNYTNNTEDVLVSAVVSINNPSGVTNATLYVTESYSPGNETEENTHILEWTDIAGPITAGTLDFVTGELIVTAPTSGTYNIGISEINLFNGSNYIYSDSGNIQVHVAETHKKITYLDDMPFNITVSGAGDAGETTVVIRRADSFYLDRPDESSNMGYANEVVAMVTQAGEDVIEIDNDDLIGSLDDGATYKISIIVMDTYGQVAELSPEEEPEFIVRWEHQALIPEAIVEPDQENQVVKITPTTPVLEPGDEILDTDHIDIYRLSIDKPVLIYRNANIGDTYVDPYPTLGEYGGHRIVYRTKNGDFITKDQELAWTDYYGRIDTMYNIIDFDGGRVELMYNIVLNNSWEKDFEQTTYLNGTTEGDWKAGVKRSGDLSSVLITTKDQDMIRMMRRLAEHEGPCHVRTREGSSYTANVNVSISQDMGRNVEIADISLSIERIDSPGLDGITLEDWLEG